MSADPTDSAPPVILRIQRPVRVFELALIAVAVIGIWIPGNFLTAFFCILIGAALAAEAYLTARMLRLRRHVRANDYKVCPTCAAPLQGQRSKQPCPQCGAVIDAANLATLWQGPCALGR